MDTTRLYPAYPMVVVRMSPAGKPTLVPKVARPMPTVVATPQPRQRRPKMRTPLGRAGESVGRSNQPI